MQKKTMSGERRAMSFQFSVFRFPFISYPLPLRVLPLSQGEKASVHLKPETLDLPHFSPPLPSVLCYLLSVICTLYSVIYFCTLPLLTSPPPFSAFTFSFLDYFYYLCRDYEAKKHSKDKQGSTNDNKREETTSAVARIAIIIHSHIPVGSMVLR